MHVQKPEPHVARPNPQHLLHNSPEHYQTYMPGQEYTIKVHIHLIMRIMYEALREPGPARKRVAQRTRSKEANHLPPHKNALRYEGPNKFRGAFSAALQPAGGTGWVGDWLEQNPIPGLLPENKSKAASLVPPL